MFLVLDDVTGIPGVASVARAADTRPRLRRPQRIIVRHVFLETLTDRVRRKSRV